MISTGDYAVDDANFEAEQDILSEELMHEYEFWKDEDTDLDIEILPVSREDSWYAG